MQFQIFALTLLATLASAAPSYGGKYGGGGSGGVCPANTTPECCEVSVAGVVATTCTAVRNPKNAARFEKLCAATGTTAQCCTIGAGGIGLLCTAV